MITPMHPKPIPYIRQKGEPRTKLSKIKRGDVIAFDAAMAVPGMILSLLFSIFFFLSFLV